MPRRGKMLTDLAVRTALKSARKKRIYDGQGKGLCLAVTGTGSGSWLLRAQRPGADSRSETGLGSARDVSLAEARELTAQCRRWIREGKDPKSELRRLRTRAPVATVRQVAQIGARIRASHWKNPEKAIGELRQRFDKYIPGYLKNMPVTEVTRREIIKVLDPIWEDHNPTARRVKSDIGWILQWAMDEGLRQDNPALGSMATALPAPKPGGHRRTLPYSEVGSALQFLLQSGASLIVKLYCELVFLSALRGAEVRYARRSELDLKMRRWNIPPERMKKPRPHMIPLTARMLYVLEETKKFAGPDPDIVFAGDAEGGFLGENTLAEHFRRHSLGMSPHGIRSSFRNWCAENDVDHIQADICLHHQILDGSRRAYFTTPLIEQRRQIMHDWGEMVFHGHD